MYTGKLYDYYNLNEMVIRFCTFTIPEESSVTLSEG